MRSTSRVVLCAAFAAGPLLLATGCGEQADGARTTLVDIQPTSYVLQDPVTTTTTTTTVPGAAPEGGAEGEISPVEQQYTIQGGDAIFKIANLFGIEPQALVDYNGWEDGFDHFLLPGTVILIPPNAKIPAAGGGSDSGSEGDAEADPADDAADQGDSAPASGCLHTIEAGENPTKVADKYGITLDQLRAANANNAAINSFVAGQQLLIPPEGDCPD